MENTDLTTFREGRVKIVYTLLILRTLVPLKKEIVGVELKNNSTNNDQESTDNLVFSYHFVLF